MEEPPQYDAFPTADDDLAPLVGKPEATSIGELSLTGLSTGSYDQWTTRWSSEMRDALSTSVFENDVRKPILGAYGTYQRVADTRLNAANTPGFVRYSFLAEFEQGPLMFVHIYPEDGTEIVGVHIRDPQTGEIPPIF